MLSSDVTTRKHGSDFGWSIISFVHNYAQIMHSILVCNSDMAVVNDYTQRC